MFFCCFFFAKDVSTVVKHVHLVNVCLEKQWKSSIVERRHSFCVNGPSVIWVFFAYCFVNTLNSGILVGSHTVFFLFFFCLLYSMKLGIFERSAFFILDHSSLLNWFSLAVFLIFGVNRCLEVMPKHFSQVDIRIWGSCTFSCNYLYPFSSLGIVYNNRMTFDLWGHDWLPSQMSKVMLLSSNAILTSFSRSASGNSVGKAHISVPFIL